MTRRAALVKAFAERHLTGMQKIPSATGNFDHHGTYDHPVSKCHGADLALIDNLQISASIQQVALIDNTPVSAKSGQESTQPGSPTEFDQSRQTSPKELNVQPILALTDKLPVSANSTGADALASVLSDQMPGIRRRSSPQLIRASKRRSSRSID